jgi:hypothetical protein
MPICFRVSSQIVPINASSSLAFRLRLRSHQGFCWAFDCHCLGQPAIGFCSRERACCAPTAWELFGQPAVAKLNRRHSGHRCEMPTSRHPRCCHIRLLPQIGALLFLLLAPLAAPANAQDVSVSVDFRTTLEPHGRWSHHDRPSGPRLNRRGGTQSFFSKR